MKNKYFNFFAIHRKTSNQYIFFTPYMVSFCNRSTVFLPISGHRYTTEFRFKISTGEPDGGGRGWRRSQGKIAEAKARPPSSKPRVIQRPYCGYATPHRFGAPPRAHTSHTTSARHLKTSPHHSFVSFQAKDNNNRQQQSWPTQSNNAGTCYLNSFRQHVLTETNHTDMPT